MTIYSIPGYDPIAVKQWSWIILKHVKAKKRGHLRTGANTYLYTHFTELKQIAKASNKK